MICKCDADDGTKGAGKASGYRRRSDGVWSHATCNLPTKLYLEGFIKKMATHLNILQGGPLHNTFLSNSEIIDRTAIGVRDDAKQIFAHVDRYRWTPDTITGQSGKVARIWVYKEAK